MIVARILTPSHRAYGIVLLDVLALEHRTEIDQCKHKEHQHCNDVRQKSLPTEIFQKIRFVIIIYYRIFISNYFCYNYA